MIGLWRFLCAVGDLAVTWATDAVRWLKKPGSVVKVVCGVLAFGCLVAGIAAFEKEQRIKELSAQVIRIQLDWDADAARLQGDVDERDKRLADVAKALRAEADKLEVLKAESAEALRSLAGRVEASEQAAATWRERFEQRPDTCSAALELLDSACPDLKGY